MAATMLTSYDLNGKKDSFANWISNLSPTDTFFVSVTGKEQVKNTLFQWQTDRLAAANKDNAQLEADVAVAPKVEPTKLYSNVTQILRKSVEVSDTADSLVNWGRGRELAYQMEKAGKEIKRDLELILLQKAQAKADGTRAEPAFNKPIVSPGNVAAVVQNKADGTVRKTASFGSLVAGKASKAAGQTQTDTAAGHAAVVDKDTGAMVHMFTGVAHTAAGAVTEAQLFTLTYNLYLAGSDADIIMFHPMHASFFSSLMETAPNVGSGRLKLIDNMDTTLNKFVGSLIDPLGQQYKLVPNRYMPEDCIYFFNPKDWTQMVLREPEKIKLAKKGSSERYMIEMEVGLRHRDPWASGMLTMTTS